MFGALTLLYSVFAFVDRSGDDASEEKKDGEEGDAKEADADLGGAETSAGGVVGPESAPVQSVESEGGRSIAEPITEATAEPGPPREAEWEAISAQEAGKGSEGVDDGMKVKNSDVDEKAGDGIAVIGDGVAGLGLGDSGDAKEVPSLNAQPDTIHPSNPPPAPTPPPESSPPNHHQPTQPDGGYHPAELHPYISPTQPSTSLSPSSSMREKLGHVHKRTASSASSSSRRKKVGFFDKVRGEAKVIVGKIEHKKEKVEEGRRILHGED
jgi:hypothetical protein